MSGIRCTYLITIVVGGTPMKDIVHTMICMYRSLFVNKKNPEQDENKYGKSFKNGSPTDDVVKPPIKNMYYYVFSYFYLLRIVFLFWL